MAKAQEPESSSEEVTLPKLGDPLTDEQVVSFATLALKNIQTEYPNKPSNVVVDEASVRTPQTMHPAFYGCFDWHSSVHGHWMLVRLLKDYPSSSVDAEIRERLAENLTAENLAGELAYFEEEQHKAFERTYGWAWYLRLVQELETWDDPLGNQWRENLRGLESLLVRRTFDYLPKLTFPIRTGIHPDTGFALGQILDYARAVGNDELQDLVVDRARDYYLADVSYPTRYEPSGQDFFSTSLNEADLMRRVLSRAEFVAWFDRFLPGLKMGEGGNLLEPVTVSDVTDGYIVHLAGLDLSRAWCMEGIASALPVDDSRVELLRQSAEDHAQKGFDYVFSGHYEGEHWLATFAIYLQAGVGIQPGDLKTDRSVAKDAIKNNPENGFVVKSSVSNREIQILVGSDVDPLRPKQTAIEFFIANETPVILRDVDITIRLDPGIRLTKFDYGESKLNLMSRNESFTRFEVRRCPELALGEKLVFNATVMGTKVGSAKFEVSAKANSDGQTPVEGVVREIINVSR